MKNGEKINESLSSVIYHFTTISRAYGIMHHNAIALSNAKPGSSDLELNRGKTNYFSFTRNRNLMSGYPNSQNNSNKNYISYNKDTNKPEIKSRFGTKTELCVRIEFDGDKLNNNFKGTQADTIYKSYISGSDAVNEYRRPKGDDGEVKLDDDDWRNDAIKNQETIDPKMFRYGIDAEGGKHNPSIHSKNLSIISKENETEDRIISDKGEVLHIYNYIKRIDVLLPKFEGVINSYIKNAYLYATEMIDLVVQDKIKCGKDEYRTESIEWKDKVHFYFSINEFNSPRPSDGAPHSDIKDIFKQINNDKDDINLFSQTDKKSNNISLDHSVPDGDLRIAAQMIFWISYNLNTKDIEKTAIENIKKCGLDKKVNVKFVSYTEDEGMLMTNSKRGRPKFQKDSDGNQLPFPVKTVDFKEFIVSLFPYIEIDEDNNWKKLQKYFSQMTNQFTDSSVFIRFGLTKMVSNWISNYRSAIKKRVSDIKKDIQENGNLKKYLSYFKGDPLSVASNIMSVIRDYINAQYNYDELLYFQREVLFYRKNLTKGTRVSNLGRITGKDMDLATKYMNNLSESDIHFMVSESIKNILNTICLD